MFHIYIYCVARNVAWNKFHELTLKIAFDFSLMKWYSARGLWYLENSYWQILIWWLVWRSSKHQIKFHVNISGYTVYGWEFMGAMDQYLITAYTWNNCFYRLSYSLLDMLVSCSITSNVSRILANIPKWCWKIRIQNDVHYMIYRLPLPWQCKSWFLIHLACVFGSPISVTFG